MKKYIDAVEIGLCGRACGICRFFNKECRECRKENEKKSECVIYKCAKKRGVFSCLNCPEMPCTLMRHLLKSYCPVYDKITHKFNIIKK